MELRWTPASTATTEPLAHPDATERTRKAVTLFSNGPPPEPWEVLVMFYYCGVVGQSPSETQDNIRPHSNAQATEPASNPAYPARAGEQKKQDGNPDTQRVP